MSRIDGQIDDLPHQDFIRVLDLPVRGNERLERNVCATCDGAQGIAPNDDVVFHGHLLWNRPAQFQSLLQPKSLHPLVNMNSVGLQENTESGHAGYPGQRHDW